MVDPGFRRECDVLGLAHLLLRRGDPLDEGVDRGANGRQERIRIDAHPQHQQEQRRKDRLLARA